MWRIPIKRCGTGASGSVHIDILNQETSHIKFEGNFLPQVFLENAKNSPDAEVLHRYNIFSESVHLNGFTETQRILGDQNSSLSQMKRKRLLQNAVQMRTA